MYDDVDIARNTVEKLAVLDANEDVLTLLAHDDTLSDVMREIPDSVDDWKEKGWKAKVMWKFKENLKGMSAGEVGHFSFLPSSILTNFSVITELSVFNTMVYTNARLSPAQGYDSDGPARYVAAVNLHVLKYSQNCSSREGIHRMNLLSSVSFSPSPGM